MPTDPVSAITNPWIRDIVIAAIAIVGLLKSVGVF